MTKTTCLVSGATGWLGRELLNIFSEDKFEKIQINLISSKDKELFIKEKKYKTNSFENYKSNDLINSYFDFAFLTKEKLEKVGPDTYREINLKIISDSVNLIKKVRPTNVVLSSSGAVYDLKKSSKDEKIYSDLKKMQEEYISKACDESGSNLIISRIFNLSGRGIPSESKFALAELINKGMRDTDLVISSNYLVTRRYSDITQLLRLLAEMANRGRNGVFDSGGAKIEIRDLARVIVKEIKSKSKVIAFEVDLDSEHDEYFSKSFSYEKLLKEILGEESITIGEQIQNTRNSLLDFS